MVIFMPYYRQHGQLFLSHSRTRPSTSNGQNNPSSPTTPTTSINNYRITSNILCCFIFSIFLLIIGLFLFYISVYNAPHQNEGSPIIAIILLTIAIISFIRTCQKVRQYYIIINTRRQLIQRLRERDQTYDITLTLNNNDNPELHRSTNNDLPSYKELFPSRQNITTNDSSLPSYDDYVKTLSSPPQSQTQTNSTRCIWITDRSRTPLCIRGTVTYV